MTRQDVFYKDREYISHTYQRFPVAIRCGHGATAEDFEGNAATRSLPLKILSMEGRLPRWRQQGRILSISISFHLQKGSGMWRRTIDGNCRS